MRAFVHLPSENQREKSVLLALVSDQNPEESTVAGPQRLLLGSTYGSHLTVVFLFYGTIISLYFNPSSSHSAGRDRAAAMMFTVVTPMLNPFIYSLRNRDMEEALGKVLTMIILCLM